MGKMRGTNVRPKHILIGTSLLANGAWLALILDAFGPWSFLGGQGDLHAIVIAIAESASVGLVVVICRRSTTEIFEMGEHAERRRAMREANVCKIVPLPVRRRRIANHEATVSQSAITAAVKVAFDELAIADAQAIRANADS